MSLEVERGMIFLHRGSPSYDFYGADRKGQNLFGRRPEGQEYHSALDIHTHDGPHISTGSIFPSLSFPGVVTDLAWLGDGVKSPHELSCLHVEGANCSAGSFRGNLLKPRT